MSRLPVLSLGLILPIAGVGADEKPPPAGLTIALPSPAIVADGRTPADIHVLARRTDGTPIEDLEVKLKCDSAVDLSGWAYQGDGVYSFQFTPPLERGKSMAWVSIKGKTPDKSAKIDLNAKIPLVGALPGALEVSASPAEGVIGELDTVSVSIQAPPGFSMDLDNLTFRSSLGELGDLAAMGNGRFVGSLALKSYANPSLVMLAVSDKSNPERLYATATVPLALKKRLMARAPAGANVVLRIGDKSVGPMVAKGGSARFDDVILQPGLTEAVQVTVQNDEPTEQPFALGVKGTQRLIIVPPPAGIPADASVEAQIRVAVVSPDGQPDTAAELDVQTTAGEVTAVRHEGFGIYAIALRPTTAATTSDVPFSVSIKGEEGQKDRVMLHMTAARPATVSIEHSRGEGASNRWVVGAAAADGTVLQPSYLTNLTGARDAEWSVSGDQRVLEAVDYGGPMELRLITEVEPTGNGVASLVVVPSKSWLPADGISSAMLAVYAVDIYGYPVAGAELDLAVERGEGSVPKTATTNEHGVAQVFYTAGQTTSMVRIRASIGDRTSVGTMVQGIAGLQGWAIPQSGTATDQALFESWRQNTVYQWIEAE